MTSIQKNSARFGLGVLATLLCLTLPLSASAQDSSIKKDMLPPMTATNTTVEYNLTPNEATHPILRIAPDKTEIVKLDEDANSIIIGNPAHMNILMDNSRTLLIAARQPGATYFSVLNRDGKVIMSRHVIVTGPKENYIRIRRTCSAYGSLSNINSGQGCEPNTVFYCPTGSMCHEVRLLAGQANNNGQPGASVPSGSSSDTNIDGSAPYEEPANIDGSNDADDGSTDSESDTTSTDE